MHTQVLDVHTGSAEAVTDLTGRCRDFLAGLGADEGLLHVWVPHATAGLAILELDSGSESDLLEAMRELLPPQRNYRHRHGSTGHGRDHVLPAFCPPYASIPVVGGRLTLGTWQSICLVDTNRDNPDRQVRLSFLDG